MLVKVSRFPPGQSFREQTQPNTNLDQLSPAPSIRADTVYDLGQVDSSSQVILWHEGFDSNQVVIATRWIHLVTQQHSKNH